MDVATVITPIGIWSPVLKPPHGHFCCHHLSVLKRILTASDCESSCSLVNIIWPRFIKLTYFFIQISDRVHKLDSKVLTEFKSAGHFPIDFYGTRSHRYHPLLAIKNNANTCMLASHLTATSILIFLYCTNHTDNILII